MAKNNEAGKKKHTIRNILIGLVVILVIFMFIGGSGGDSESNQSETNNGNSGTSNTDDSKNQVSDSKKFDEDAVLGQLAVEELSYKSDFSHYHFLLITNNSEYNVSLRASVNFYNADGQLIGANSASEDAVEAGHTILLYFMPDEDYSSTDYEIEVDEETFYDCVLSDLSYDSTVAKDKVILSVTNNGEEAAEFVQANVLFFNGDQLVGFSNNYIVDDDSELKPGKTINKEMECYEAFDSYRVYFSGRR